MSRPRDAWRDVGVLLVDGNNVLHALAGSASGEALRTFLARLRSRLPAGTDTLVMLDGQPDPGAPASARVAPGLALRHAGRVSADHAIVSVVDSIPFAGRSSALVVTDDAELRRRIHRLGARTQPVAWLLARLAEPPVPTARPAPGTAIGAGRPPRVSGEQTRSPAPPGAAQTAEPDDRVPWHPGRGATRKRGNPKRRSARAGGPGSM